MWPAGTFMAAYAGNLENAVTSVIEADLVATAVQQLMDKRTDWAGTASELLVALNDTVEERTTRNKGWPDTPRGLSGRLQRAATVLRKVGIEIAFRRQGHAWKRTVHIENVGK
jgi:hypothetical protein